LILANSLIHEIMMSLYHWIISQRCTRCSTHASSSRQSAEKSQSFDDVYFRRLDILSVGSDTFPHPFHPLEKDCLQSHFFHTPITPRTLSSSSFMFSNKRPAKHLSISL
jgi:hypothetical protein